MANNIPEPEANNSDWLKLDDALKKYALAIITIGSIGITLLLGPQVLYFIIGVGAITAFAVYPDIDPEYSLWGSLFGAVYAGPLGLLAGGVLGYYIGQKYEKTLRVINTVAAPVHTVMNIPTQIKNGIKSIGNAFVNGFSRANEGARQFFENEAENVTHVVANPAPAAPIVHQPKMTRAQARTAKAKAIQQTKIKAKSAPVIANPATATVAPIEPISPGALKRTWHMLTQVWNAANEFYGRELDMYNDVTQNEKKAAPLLLSQRVNKKTQESFPTTTKRRSRMPMTIM